MMYSTPEGIYKPILYSKQDFSPIANGIREYLYIT